jgi:hypothetical protein
MIDIELEEHLAHFGTLPRSYILLGLIPLFLYLVYNVRLLAVLISSVRL